MKLVWVPIMESADPHNKTKVLGINEYLPGTIKSLDQKTSQCEIMYVDSHNGPKMVNTDLLEQRALNPELEDDLCDVFPLNKAELLRNLQRKYDSDDVHADCGNTLIAINPNHGGGSKGDYKINPEHIGECIKWAKREIKEKPYPHVNCLGAKAYRQLFETPEGMPQAVCVSGESGAGKTWNTK